MLGTTEQWLWPSPLCQAHVRSAASPGLVSAASSAARRFAVTPTGPLEEPSVWLTKAAWPSLGDVLLLWFHLKSVHRQIQVTEEAAFFPQEGSFIPFSQPLEVLQISKQGIFVFFPLPLFEMFVCEMTVCVISEVKLLVELLWKQRCDVVDRGLVARPEEALSWSCGSRVKCGRGLVRKDAEGTGQGLERTPISPRASPGGPVAGRPSAVL